MSFFNKLKTDIEGDKEKKNHAPKKPPVKEKEEKKELKEEEKTKPKKEAKDWLKSEGQLAVDVFQTDSEFCVQAPIAGVDPENLDISVENNMLIIKGERKESQEIKEKNYFYQECFWGSFSRQILLPEDADPSRIKATLQKGVLTVKIPRVSQIKKRKINVSLGE